jgi:hypothetical protein
MSQRRCDGEAVYMCYLSGYGLHRDRSGRGFESQRLIVADFSRHLIERDGLRNRPGLEVSAVIPDVLRMGGRAFTQWLDVFRVQSAISSAW